MKQCAHCKALKPLDDFAWSNRLLNKRQKHCRECMAKFNRQSYERRSEEKRQEVRENRNQKMQEARQYIWDYLSTHPCVNCGETDPVVLEFDHVRGRKKANISDMPRNGHSISSIQGEIAKCEVLCANCHRRKTSKRRGWFRG